MEFIHAAVDWMISYADSPYALAALFIFAFWESSFFPLPPDPLLIAMAVGRPDLALWYAGVCTVASVLGAALGYVIGFKGGRPIAEKFFKQQRIDAASGLYQRYDAWAVGAAGCSVSGASAGSPSARCMPASSFARAESTTAAAETIADLWEAMGQVRRLLEALIC